MLKFNKLSSIAKQVVHGEEYMPECDCPQVVLQRGVIRLWFDGQPTDTGTIKIYYEDGIIDTIALYYSGGRFTYNLQITDYTADIERITVVDNGSGTKIFDEKVICPDQSGWIKMIEFCDNGSTSQITEQFIETNLYRTESLENEREVFETTSGKIIPIEQHPRTLYTVRFGGVSGVPVWQLDALNYKIGKTEFMRIDGQPFQVTEPPAIEFLTKNKAICTIEGYFEEDYYGREVVNLTMPKEGGDITGYGEPIMGAYYTNVGANITILPNTEAFTRVFDIATANYILHITQEGTGAPDTNKIGVIVRVEGGGEQSGTNTDMTPGATQNITQVQNAAWHFQEWTGTALPYIDNPQSPNTFFDSTGVNRVLQAVAVFNLNGYTLSLSSSNEAWGQIIPSGNIMFNALSGIQEIQAVANNAEYAFVNYTGSGANLMSNGGIDLSTIQQDIAIIANFRRFGTITVSVNVAERGTVAPNGVIHYTGYITFYPMANSPYIFRQWSGSAMPYIQNNTFTPPNEGGDFTLIADFDYPSFSVDNATPTLGTVSPIGTLEWTGTPIHFTLTPASEDIMFAGWSGSGTQYMSWENILTIPDGVDNIALIATFKYAGSVTIANDGSDGLVSPLGKKYLIPGAYVNVAAAPNNGYKYRQVTGDTQYFLIDTDLTSDGAMIGKFTMPDDGEYNITIDFAPVEIIFDTTNHGSLGTATNINDTNQWSLSGTPDTGYYLDYWQLMDIDSSKATINGNIVTVHDTVPVHIRAQYNPILVFLNMSTSPAGIGSTSPSGRPAVAAGSQENIGAFAYTNWTFSHWTGTAVNDGLVEDPTSNMTVFNAPEAASEYTLCANYTVNTGTLSIDSDTGLTCEPTGVQNMDAGTNVLVTATPSAEFSGWTGTAITTDRCVVNGNTCRFYMPSWGGNYTLFAKKAQPTAKFLTIRGNSSTYYVTGNSDPNVDTAWTSHEFPVDEGGYSYVAYAQYIADKYWVWLKNGRYYSSPTGYPEWTFEGITTKIPSMRIINKFGKYWSISQVDGNSPVLIVADTIAGGFTQSSLVANACCLCDYSALLLIGTLMGEVYTTNNGTSATRYFIDSDNQSPCASIVEGNRIGGALYAFMAWGGIYNLTMSTWKSYTFSQPIKCAIRYAVNSDSIGIFSLLNNKQGYMTNTNLTEFDGVSENSFNYVACLQDNPSLGVFASYGNINAEILRANTNSTGSGTLIQFGMVMASNQPNFIQY